MRRFLRWLFGVDSVEQRPTHAARRLEGELRDALARLDVVEDRLETHGDRLDRMRARITSVQRSVNQDDEPDDEEEDELLNMIEERRRAHG